MATAVDIVFSPGGKVQAFDPGPLELAWNERVICSTARGPMVGRVVTGNHEISLQRRREPLRPIERRVTPEDEAVERENRRRGRLAILAMRDLLHERKLEEARPIAADVTFDGSRITISYRSEQRVELRALQGPLSHRLDARVDLRQVNSREAARQCEGGGMCGPVKCCTRFPTTEAPVTLKMAKEQDLPMNPGRITGMCGRLRCCLAFEHPVYRSFRDRAPAVGRMVGTAQGNAIVRDYRVPEDSLVVELESDGSQLVVALDDTQEPVARGSRSEAPRNDPR